MDRNTSQLTRCNSQMFRVLPAHACYNITKHSQ